MVEEIADDGTIIEKEAQGGVIYGSTRDGVSDLGRGIVLVTVPA